MYMCAYICMYMHVCLHITVYLYVCMYMCVHVCLCVYVCMYSVCVYCVHARTCMCVSSTVRVNKLRNVKGLVLECGQTQFAFTATLFVVLHGLTVSRAWFSAEKVGGEALSGT